MAPLIITTILTIIMIVLSFTPLYFVSSYIVFRPLLQSFATQNYEILPGIPLTAFLPVILISFTILLCIYRKDFKIMPPGTFLLYLLSLTFLSSLIFTQYLVVSIAHLIKFITAFAVYILAYNSIKTVDDLNKLLTAIVISSIIPMLIGYYQYFAELGRAGVFETTNRISGGLGEPNAYGIFLSLCMCSGLILFLSTNSRTKKILMSLILSSMIISSLIALNRGSWIASIASCCFVYFYYREKFNLKQIFIVFTVLLLLFSGTMTDRFGQLHKPNSEGKTHNTFQTRIDNWEKMISLIPDRLLIGYGVGTTERVIEKRFIKGNAPHNDYLRLLFEAGILSSLIYIIFLFKQVYYCIMLSKDKRNWFVNLPVLLGLIYWIIISLVQNIVFNVYSFSIFLTILAIHRRSNEIFHESKKKPC